MNQSVVDPFALVVAIRTDYAAGNIDAAKSKLNAAFAQFPQHPDVLFEAGVLYVHHKQWAEAEAMFRQVVTINPRYLPARKNLAVCQMELTNYLAAEGILLDSFVYGPNDPEVPAILGDVYLRQDKLKQACSQLERAARISPNLSSVQSSLGVVYSRLKRYDEARVAFDRAAKLGSVLALNYYNLGSGYALAGEADKAIEVLNHALSLDPTNQAIASALIMASINSATVSGSELLATANRYEAVVSARGPIVPFVHATPEPLEGRSIRIGFYSNDLKHHALGQFLIEILRCLDKAKYQLFAYSNTPNFDQTTMKIIPEVATFADMRHLTPYDAAKAIFDDSPDILIDLSGHTMDNRSAVLAYKPAPIIASWLGFLAPYGLQAVDYHITDCHANPPGKTEAVFNEKLVRLPRTMYAYAPTNLLTRPIEIGPTPAKTNGFITFGCFGYPTKIVTEVIELWARVLREVPNSKMLIYCEADETKQRIYREFEKNAIKRARIKFCGRVGVDEYFERHNKVDITLDSFPFVSGTTVADSTYMGVPMVSRFVPRGFGGQSRSVLAQVGLEHHATNSNDEYVALAKDLASDLARLNTWRISLRHALARSPMMKAPLVTADFERALHMMLNRHQSGLPPDHLDVPIS